MVGLVAVWCGDFGAWGAAGTGRSVALESNVSTLSPFLEGNIFSGFRAVFFSVIPTLFAFQESD